MQHHWSLFSRFGRPCFCPSCAILVEIRLESCFASKSLLSEPFLFKVSKLQKANASRVYRSRQYYEYKVLHNTEVTWFSTSRHSPKTDYFDRNWKMVDISRNFVAYMLWGLILQWKLPIFCSKEALWTELRHSLTISI